LQTRTNWKSKFLVVALTAVSLSATAFAQIGIVIGRTPTPLRYERRGPPPGAGFLWVDGYWGLDRGRYVWVPGRWERPPYAGAYWSHPHYDRYEDGWHYHEGHWDREDHGDHRFDDRHDDRRNDYRDDHHDDRH
jgi:hypothetical protein